MQNVPSTANTSAKELGDSAGISQSDIRDPMTGRTTHTSDSNPQRIAEAAALRELERLLGFPVAGERIDLGEGFSANVDGMSRENHFICEIYSRIGKLQTAQIEKVASDILKLQVIERALGGDWRKAICFADEQAAKSFRNKSWYARAAKDLGVEILVVRLPEHIREGVLRAQARQVMVNKVLGDSER